jgi:DNA-binding transcriptional ArsR family regulator
MMVIDAHQSASVREIFKELKLEQSLISQHLKILRNAKIVSSSRRGKYVYYSIEYANVQYTTGAIRSFMQNEAKAAISVLEDN